MTPPRAPSGLGKAGKRLWKAITGIDGLELRPDEIEVLEQACALRDQIERLQQAADTGPVEVTGSRGQVVIAPAIQELRHSRAELARLLRQLAIPDPEDEGDEEGEWDGLTASQRARKAARARWGR